MSCIFLLRASCSSRTNSNAARAAAAFPAATGPLNLSLMAASTESRLTRPGQGDEPAEQGGAGQRAAEVGHGQRVRIGRSSIRQNDITGAPIRSEPKLGERLRVPAFAERSCG